jgi:preprotein translocase subunit SecA
MRIFGSVKIGAFLGKLGLKDDEAIEHPWINKSLAKAQQKVEERNYEMRKNLLKFDDVMSEQRNVIYKQRIEIMREEKFDDILKEKVLVLNKHLVDEFVPEKSYREEWQQKEMIHEMHRVYGTDFNFEGMSSRKDVLDGVNDLSMKLMDDKKKKFGEDIFNEAVKRIFLVSLDQLWKEHLHALDRLKAGINLRAYGQKDPLNEYKFEAFQLFERLFLDLDEQIIIATAKFQISHKLSDLEDSNVMQNTVETKDIMSKFPSNNKSSSNGQFGSLKGADIVKNPKNPSTWGRVSRNELCPCNSNKKYKHCHGSIK